MKKEQLTPQKIMRGLPTKTRKSGAIAAVADGRMVAEAFVNPTRGVRVNLRNPIKKEDGVFKPTRGQGQWGAFAYVTPENAEAVRKTLETTVKAEGALLERATQPTAAAKTSRRSTRSSKTKA